MKTHWLSRSIVGLVLGIVACTAFLAYGITEEVPIGSMSGTAIMKENGKALPKAHVVLIPQKDTASLTDTRVVRTDKDGKFRFRNLPAGHYTLEASGKAHSLDAFKVEIKEGQAVVESLALEPGSPYLDLYTSQKVFTPGEKVTVELKGFGPGDGMKLKVYKIDTDKVIAKGGLQGMFSAFARAKTDGGVNPAEVASATQDYDHSITTRDIEGVFLERPELPPLTEGFYWVQANVGDLSKGTYINVSKIGLITKTSGQQLLAYVADLETGQPIAASKIQFYRGGKPVAEGATDSDGKAEITMPPLPKPVEGEGAGDAPAGGPGLAVATLAGSSAVVDFGMTREGTASKNKIFMYTDRPIYGPGDEVHFKGIIRTLKGSDYTLPGGGTAQVEIHDSSDNLVERQTVKIDPKGLFSSSFSTNKETDPGEYSVKVKALGAEERLGVSLADYRKPEYVVKIVPAKLGYVVGDRAKATIQCEYYFGGPVIGAKVIASLSRSPAYSFEDEEGETESYGSGSGEDTKEFNLVTDEEGKATIEFDTSTTDPNHAQNDWMYHVDASVTEGEKYFDGQGDIRVNQGAYALEVRNETGFVEPERPVAVTVFTREHDGKTAIPGRHVKLTVGTQEWNDQVEDFTPEQTLDAVTDQTGAATVTFTPKAEGTYLIKGASSDDSGHSIEAEDSLYVEGGPYFVGGKEQAFEVTLDQRKYKVGNTAKALIRTSTRGFSCLMTVEADRVLWSKVVRLDQTSTVVDLPVVKDYAPNAFVTITAIRGKTYLESSVRLLIDDERRQLKIKITPDRENHKPGEKATYAVQTTDPTGHPVAADVSVAVVDESIYAIQEDRTNPESAFYPKREDSVDTRYSFPEIYLDGGDKGGHVPIRRKFRDTAFWSPNVRTDANGNASVTVTLPDNLTQWRTTCVGVTDDTRVGTGKCDIRSSKPLMVRIETPMFVTVGDRLTFQGIIQNNTGKDAEVHLRLDPTNLEVSGEKIQTLHIPSGKPETVEWTMDAKQAGDAKLTARAWVDGGDSDGVEQIVPVNPAGLIIQERKAGIAKGVGKLTVNVSPDADHTYGRLVVNVSPTIAQAMFQSLDELIGYPYGCVEQTMSRFMPAVLVQKALKGAPSPRPDLTKQIPQIATESLSRLKRMQHADGGWGWWEYDKSEPFMTAYVLDGLARSNAAGYKVNQFLIDKGMVWGAKYLASPMWEPIKGDSDKQWIAYRKAEDRRSRLYLAYAMSEHGDKASAGNAVKLFDPQHSDAIETAYSALLLHSLGSPEAGAAYTRLKGLGKIEGGMASWSPGRDFWNVTEPTAVALTALAEKDPKDPMVEMAARYLMRSRQGDWWYTTRDTAFALVGLSSYLAQTGELANPQNVTVKVNGQTVKTFAFGAASSTAPETRIEIPMASLKVGDNVVEVDNGGGVTYFGVDLRQAVSTQGARTIGNDSGLTLTREFFRLEARKLEDGTQRLMPSANSISQVKSGDIIRCDVNITADRPREFVMVEVPIPSNCRVTDSEDPLSDNEWTNWWARTVIRDDRVTFFIRSLPAGKSDMALTFTLRAEADGTATAGPATGANMYDPAQASHSSAQPIEVNRS